jgi:CoA:oxalate CoA-transferase
MGRKKVSNELRNQSGNPSQGALSGFKVIEIGNNVAAAYCCKLLADMGAEVVKVEDPATVNLDRQEGSIWSDDKKDRETGCLFAYENSNKLGITLNLETELGKSVLYDLVRDADVLVEGNSPRRAKEMGLNYERLNQINSMLVVTSITPFGQTGPYQEYKTYALNISGASSASKSIGELGREPLSVPLYQPHFQSGLMAATTTCGAILARESIGRGQHIDIGETEVWLTHLAGYGLHGFIFYEQKVIRKGRTMAGLFPNGILECKDGEVSFSTNTGRQWKHFLEIVGDGEMPGWYSSNPAYTSTNFQELHRKYGDELRTQLEPLLMRKTRDELMELGQEKHVALAPLRTISEVTEDQHLNARDYFTEVDDPKLGRVKVPEQPFRFSKTPMSVKHPAPTPGQHNEEIYCGRLGYSKEYMSQLRREGVI